MNYRLRSVILEHRRKKISFSKWLFNPGVIFTRTHTRTHNKKLFKALSISLQHVHGRFNLRTNHFNIKQVFYLRRLRRLSHWKVNPKQSMKSLRKLSFVPGNKQVLNLSPPVGGGVIFTGNML